MTMCDVHIPLTPIIAIRVQL